MAVKGLDNYLPTAGKHIFLGFNALNTAEQKIIEGILDHTDSVIYWDIDRYFLEDPVHDAGYFIRKHRATWAKVPKKSLPQATQHYGTPKHIEIIGVPKNIAQAKYVGSLLGELAQKDALDYNKTALILGDEQLLEPVLNALPSAVPNVNITMGQSLSSFPLSAVFHSYIDLANRYTPQKGWYYQDFIAFLKLPELQCCLRQDTVSSLIRHLTTNNIIYVTTQTIVDHFGEHPESFGHILLLPSSNNPKKVLQGCLELVQRFKASFSEDTRTLLMEQLFRINGVIQNLSTTLERYDYIKKTDTLHRLFKELISQETLDYEGDPIDGLQIMGMLESRNLDFETIILTSVNEGILPAGKSNNSFIPFDLKQANALPTYKEKDAVYTYHFYRLLQRAKNVYLLHTTEPDAMEGGETSRLILQLLTDGNRTDIITRNLSPQIQDLA